MGLWNRLFSGDFRAAVAAEASGDLEHAAERYALAGQPEAAARVHLARAARAASRHDEIAALRDALHWAPDGHEVRRQARRGLGLALLARARAEAVATDRDRDHVREAALHLAAAGEHRAAADAFELCGDDDAAAAALRAGGLVNLLEDALDRDAERSDRTRAVREAWADFELAERGGARDEALAALRRCVAEADDKIEYRRRLDDLESRVLIGARVCLAVRRGPQLHGLAGPALVLGRDPLVELPLRSAGVSRSHARIRRDPTGFVLEDLGSRNGTRVGGLPIAGPLPLGEVGRFALGDDCELDYQVGPELLRLSIERGLDRGLVAYHVAPGRRVALAEHGPAAELWFARDRPFLRAAGPLTLNGERLIGVDVQLGRGDQLVIDGVELEVVG